MYKLFCLCVILCTSTISSAQNLFQTSGYSKLVNEPVIELYNSVYYLTSSLDSPAGERPYVSYYLSRVDTRSGLLQKTVLLLADTATNPDENVQNLALVYCVNSTGTGINIFTLNDDDSSQKYHMYSPLWQYPKSISFFQLDTALTETVPRKKILNRLPFSRYAFWFAGSAVQLYEDGCVFMYAVRDTLLFDGGYSASIATKMLIVDDTGKVLNDKFVGYEPTGNDTYFPNHSAGKLFKLPAPYSYGTIVLFEDSIFTGEYTKVMLLDPDLNMLDTIDCVNGMPIENQIPGKKEISFLGLRFDFFCLPSGSICCYSIGDYKDSLSDSSYEYYALAKGSLRPGYHVNSLYFPPKAIEGDYYHSAEGLNNACYNANDNNIYSFSSTSTYSSYMGFCMNGQPNLGQLACVDTNLQEQWVKYVHAKPGYCMRTFGVSQPDKKAGVIISGILSPMDDPNNTRLWECFIYYVDSTTRLGVDDPNNPLVITNQFSLYPNPASSELVIENVLGGAFEYVVTNMAGSVVERGKGQGTKTLLNVAPLASGIYSIRIFDTKTKQACTLRFLRP